MQKRVKIYGVEKRREMIERTATKIGLSHDDIYYDDRPNGGNVLYTAKKAWLSDWGDSTHGIVLQDDCEVCNDFLYYCRLIINTHPSSIISLFPFDYMHKNDSLDMESPYFECGILSGVGIIMPIKYIEPCFEWIDKTFSDTVADDYAITVWARRNNINMITTLPSLVQHIGDESILGDREVRRTFYYDANPVANWDNGYIHKIVKLMPKPFSK